MGELIGGISKMLQGHIPALDVIRGIAKLLYIRSIVCPS